MQKYVKTVTKEIVTAQESKSGWKIVHADGDVTYLSDAKFQKRYTLVQE